MNSFTSKRALSDFHQVQKYLMDTLTAIQQRKIVFEKKKRFADMVSLLLLKVFSCFIYRL